MKEGNGEALTLIQTSYDDGGLPPPEAVGGLGTLQSYCTKESVLQRVKIRCGLRDLDEARKVLALAFESIASSPDPTKLLRCDPRSIVNCAIQGVLVSVPVDQRGLAHLVPYPNKHKGCWEAKYQPSYHGYIFKVKLVYRDFDCWVGWVFEGDEFSIEKGGTVENYKHAPVNPFNDKYDGARGLYCYGTYKVGGEQHSFCTPIPMSEILKARAAAKQKDIWTQWFRQQAEKTAIRNALRIKFKTLTIALDQLDNQHFDLEGAQAGLSSADALKTALNNEKKMMSCLEPPRDQETAPAIEIVTDSEIPQTVEALGNAATNAEHLAEAEEAVADGWDGKTLVGRDGVKVSRAWKTDKQSYFWLIDEIIAEPGGPSARQDILEANSSFIQYLEDNKRDGLIKSLKEAIHDTKENEA